MRMWMVEPELMCDRHLLGEHVELHMLAGTLRRGKSIRGFVEKGLVETPRMQERHKQLAAEMARRGMEHRSPLPDYPDPGLGKVDPQESLAELRRRCPACRARMAAAGR